MKERVGLFFGSFNPIHVGHLIIANHIVQYHNIDQVCFVISPQNPDKQKQTLLPDYHRRSLVNIAIEDNPNFISSDIEFSLSKPSYTINTLVHLQEKYPTTKFSLIMGEDNLNTLHRWKNAEQIISTYPIIVYPRATNNLKDKSDSFLSKAEIIWSEAPKVTISSTHIRQLIQSGKSAKYLLSEKVLHYVEEMHFYK